MSRDVLSSGFKTPSLFNSGCKQIHIDTATLWH